MTTTPEPLNPVGALLRVALPVALLLINPAFCLVIVATLDGHSGPIMGVYALGLVAVGILSRGASRFAVAFYRLKLALLAMTAATAIAAYLTIWMVVLPLWLSLACSAASLLALGWFVARKSAQARIDDVLHHLRKRRLVDLSDGTFDMGPASQGALDYQSSAPARMTRGIGLLASVVGWAAPALLGASFALGRLGWSDARLLVISLCIYGFVFGLIHLAVLPGRIASALKQLETSAGSRLRITGV